MVTENDLQIARFYPHLVELKLSICAISFLSKFLFYPHLVELKPTSTNLSATSTNLFYPHLVELKRPMRQLEQFLNPRFIPTWWN